MSIRKTHIQFVAQIKNVNPLIEVLGYYNGDNKPVEVKCRDCGYIWTPTASSLVQGHGCPKCAKNRQLSSEEFKKIIAEKWPNICLNEEYVNSKTDISCTCLKCGYTWSTKPSVLKNGKGCPKCSGHGRRTQADFIKELERINSDIIVDGIYENYQSKLKLICKRCGNHWEARAGNLLRGVGCPKCAKNQRYTADEFKQLIEKKFPGIEVVGNYTRSSQPIKCKCRKCGYIWSPTASSLVQGHGCPKCGIETSRAIKTKSNEQFLKELQEVTTHIVPLEPYINDIRKIQVQCLDCGYIWDSKPNHLLRGHGCPKCNQTSTSFQELFILEAYKEKLGKESVIHRDLSLIGMELDIYIPSLKLAIEPGSWYWHKDRTFKDKEKHELCKEQGIRLITIYDACDENYTGWDDCWVYTEALYDYNGISLLKELIQKLFSISNLSADFTPFIWDKIISRARTENRKRNTKWFREQMAVINNKIEILGDYISTNQPIRVKCKECGFEWNGIPKNLLRGVGCRKCGYKKAWEKRKSLNVK